MLLGILSVLQAVFLPGYLALRLSRASTGSRIETWVVSFALSLLINYLWVFVLTLLGLYGRASVFVLVAFEVVALGNLLTKSLRKSGFGKFTITVPDLHQRDRLRTSIVVIASLTLLFALLVSLKSGLRFRVFDSWDAIVSWNTWAYSWFVGEMPRPVSVYPQLWPANWSMMYHIAGSPELQLFPLSTVPLFALAILSMFFDLALRRRRVEYLGAMLFCSVGLLVPSGSMFEGYVDLPLAFMAMAAFYTLELRDSRCPAHWRQLALPLLIACAAAVTKFNGLYVLAVVLVLGLIGHLAQRHRLSSKDWGKSAGLVLSTVAAVPGSWFLLKALDFAAGRDASNRFYLNQAVEVAAGSNSIQGRLLHAVSLFPGSWVTFGAIVLIVLIAVRVPRARWVALGVLVPYTILWAMFLSYDLRNLVMMIPVIAYVAAMGLGGLLESGLHADMELKVREFRGSISPRLFRALFLLAAVAAVVLLITYPTSKVIELELQKQRLIGNPQLNDVLYSVTSQEPNMSGDVLTDYGHLQYLPEFRDDPLRLEHSNSIHVSFLYQKVVTPDSLIGRDYLVLSNLVPPAVEELVTSRIADGSYSLLEEFDSGPFVEYRSPVKVRVIRVNR